MKYRINHIVLIVCALTLVVGIGAAVIQPVNIGFKVPEGWPAPEKDLFAKNKITREGFELGRRLFYDPNLSIDGMVSCGSCHQQFAAFATFDHDLSHGVNNRFTRRNAPGLFNLAWMNGWHWDGGVNHLEVQALSPLTNPDEMGETLEGVIKKIKADSEYQRMFRAAYRDRKITSERMLKSLAQFMGTMVSANSKYDKVMRGETTFNRVEARGYVLFKQHCASCHKEPLFTDNTFRNNGQQLNRLNDMGRMEITGDPADSLKFKVPSLRNVQVTYPYMHDGSIFSVPQVLDHYTSIDTLSKTLDPLLRKPIVLSRREKTEITYFLYSLTDSTFLKDPRFSAPPNAAPSPVLHPH